MHKEECKKALLDGMTHCDPDSGETHGSTASMDCLDYSLDLSGITQDDNPPWDEHPKFPPPESRPKGDGYGDNSVACDTKAQPGRPLTEDQTNKAIAAYCKDGVTIPGFGEHWSNMFNYPPKGEPQFYDDDAWYTMHLGMGAETIDNNGGKQFYADSAWYEGYDQKLHTDDCNYAFRKALDTCKQRDKFVGGTYAYRCANYKT